MILVWGQYDLYGMGFNKKTYKKTRLLDNIHYI